jgi:hypothetical protein
MVPRRRETETESSSRLESGLSELLFEGASKMAMAPKKEILFEFSRVIQKGQFMFVRVEVIIESTHPLGDTTITMDLPWPPDDNRPLREIREEALRIAREAIQSRVLLDRYRS